MKASIHSSVIGAAKILPDGGVTGGLRDGMPVDEAGLERGRVLTLPVLIAFGTFTLHAGFAPVSGAKVGPPPNLTMADTFTNYASVEEGGGVFVVLVSAMVRVISVPMPWSVKISSRMAWRSR